jgi:8-oxo-dGTP diphosphatase
MLAEIIQKPLLVVLIGILMFNLIQRRHLDHGEKKRYATLGMAGILLVIYVATITAIRYALPDYVLIGSLTVAVFLGLRYRRKLFVFSLKCKHCGSSMPIQRTLYYDDNLCGSCLRETSSEGPRTIDDIDWTVWQPDQDAVLCFVMQDDKVLLIHKKTGLGAGKVNAPGGRIEEGESSAQAAVRECKEEVGLTPLDLEKRADLSFHFTDGFTLHCSAYFAKDHEGTLIETDEADPFWCEIGDIPFPQMWEDDAVWLPIALGEKRVVGRFIFDGDAMLSKDVREIESFG